MSHLSRPSFDKRKSTWQENIDIFKTSTYQSRSSLSLGLHISHLYVDTSMLILFLLFFFLFSFLFFLFLLFFFFFFSSSFVLLVFRPLFLLFTTRMESLKEKGNRRKMSIGSESLSWSLYFTFFTFFGDEGFLNRFQDWEVRLG